MRSLIYRRRARANDLRISVRDDDPKIPDDPNSSDSDDDDDDNDDGKPDSPSPTSPHSPPPQISDPTQPTGETSSPVQISTTSSVFSQPTESTGETSSSAQISSTSSISSQPTTLASSTSVSVTPTSSISASITQSVGAEPQNTDAIQAQASQQGGGAPSMGRGGTIAFGTIGAVVIVAALVVFVWRCRRRQKRKSGSEFSRSTPPSGFKRMEEARRPVTADYGSSGSASSRDTPSRIMDNLMRAAYAAEDGNASQYGAYVDERGQPNGQSNTFGPAADPRQPVSVRQSSASVPQPPMSGGTNSLYVNQLMSGFYKGQAADGLTAPPNARMPPPAAPSVAGQTEVTASSESTWRTWGWSQPKQQPREGWVDKCVRLGGLR
ncbi:hypothetical protein F5B19DRAFT_287142 [Rostrohypoxylon terebratum]|nr:hypothetical protein F5B19DRAFT_287142 [Rostrohypoxylon terebratum]